MGCINSSIKILRLNSSGQAVEDYSQSEVRELLYIFTRTGGCTGARFEVVRRINEIGSLMKGDQIVIYYRGTTVWRGVVDDFVSKAQSLEIMCVGAWAACQALFPDNRVYGTAADFGESDGVNEFNDIVNCQAIMSHLFDAYLSSSDLTDTSLAGASTSRELERLELDGSQSLASICEYLAKTAGNWAVGIDEEYDFFLTNPTEYTQRDFKACVATTYQITDMDRTDGMTWTTLPTSFVIQGAGDFQETFNAEDFGYTLPSIAGITIRNQRVISLPFVKPTESKLYDGFIQSQISVDSVDAAQFADILFYGQAIDDPVSWNLECENVNEILFPWEDSIELYDQDGQDMGLFLIEEMSYHSIDSNITIKEMTIRKLRSSG